MVAVTLFGRLSIRLSDGTTGAPDGRPARLLVAWLAAHPGLHTRGELATALWPDVLDSSARASLRTALAKTRSFFSGSKGALIADRDEIGFAEDVSVDLLIFEDLLERGQITEAISLCSGSLLEDLSEQWVLDLRTRVEDRLEDAYRELASRALTAGDYDKAIAWGRRRLALAPRSERAARDLMRAHAGADDRGAALEVYRRLRERLRSELALTPSQTTRALADELAGEGGRGWTPTALPSPLAASSASLFGRREALGALRSDWDNAAAGWRLTIVAGEAGIGKSSVVARLARDVDAEGADVLLGRCSENPVAPFEPWLEAIGRFVRERAPLEAELLVGELESDLAPLLPVAASTGDARPEDLAQRRFRLVEAVATLLERVASDRPVLLLLEDLHWADRASIDLLQFVLRAGRRGHLHAVVTTRRRLDVPVTEHARTVALDRLSRSSIGAIVRQETGAAAAPATVEALARHTGGNPFYLRELMRHLEAAGSARVRDEEWRLDSDALSDVPLQVAELIHGRQRALSDAAREALEVAAVMGSAFPQDALEHALGRAPERRDAIDQLVTAGFISTPSGEAKRFAFTHDIVRHAIYEELPLPRRRRLHGEIARALERAEPQAPAQALAHHYFGAGARSAALRWSRRAADVALERLAFVESVELYERALELCPGGDAARCDLLLGLADARWGAGEFEQARLAFREAAEIARADGLHEPLARAVLGFLGQNTGYRYGHGEEFLPLIDEAIAGLGGDEPALLARLYACRGEYAIGLEPRENALAAADEAERLAVQSGDGRAGVHVRLRTIMTRWNPDDVAVRIEAARRLVEQADKEELPFVAGQAIGFRIVSLFEVGRFREGFDVLESHAPYARRLPYRRWVDVSMRASRALLEGDLEAAERGVEDTLRAGGESGHAADLIALVLHFSVQVERGDLAPTLPVIQAAQAVSPLAGFFDVLEARARAATEGAAAAVAVDNAFKQFAGAERDALWLSRGVDITEAVADSERLELAEQLVDWLRPYAARFPTYGQTSIVAGPVALGLGRLLAMLDRQEEAGEVLGLALRIAEDNGLGPMRSRLADALSKVATGR